MFRNGGKYKVCPISFPKYRGLMENPELAECQRESDRQSRKIIEEVITMEHF